MEVKRLSAILFLMKPHKVSTAEEEKRAYRLCKLTLTHDKLYTLQQSNDI